MNNSSKQSKLNKFFNIKGNHTELRKKLKDLIPMLKELESDIKKDQKLEILKENIEGLILLLVSASKEIELILPQSIINEIINSDQMIELLKNSFSLDLAGSSIDM